MHRWAMRVGLAALVLWMSAAAAAAERVALVIANGDYRHVADLANPPRDARAIAEHLVSVGFDQPTVVYDADLIQMRDALLAFRDRAAGAELALIYYAGHGQSGLGENFLMPVDANPRRRSELDLFGVGLRTLTSQMMGSGADHVLIILDACRNDGFEANFSGEGRAAARGFSVAEVSVARDADLEVWFSTGDGQIASDGVTGGHSPFAQALMTALGEAGHTQHTLFQRVAGLMRTLAPEQRPDSAGRFLSDVAMTPQEIVPTEPADQAAEPPGSAAAIELAFWGSAEAGGTAADYRAYLDAFPDGVFAALARARLSALDGPEEGDEVARLEPPEPTLSAPAPVEISTTARHAVLVDVSAGTVLGVRDADTPIPPSSMSKLMTVYMIFSRLADGRLQMAGQLPVSEQAWAIGGSRMFLEIGQRVSVSDLLRGIIVASGNDACIVVAEAVSGSEAAFVEAMNQEAERIGLTSSHFVNATGWPDPEHLMTARDLATLATRLILDYPEYYQLFAETEFTYNGIAQQNRTPLLLGDLGVDGLTTGHSEEGGYGAVVSAERDGRRLLVVIAGLDNAQARASEAQRLLEWGFREL